jgi:hypothetical protein
VAELKTKKNRASVAAFLNAIEPAERRKDCKTIARMMKEATGARPAMWGESIVGYGSYHYRYASGREGDWFLTGFAARKQDLTIYLGTGQFRQRDALLKKLGKHRTGKSCLYIKKLADVDLEVLRQLIEGCAAAKEKFGGC